MKRSILIGLFIPLASAGAMAWDTPTMGWSSWNSFGHRINEDIIRSQADAMVSNGLKDAGYLYVNLDDGAWCGRDAEGHLRVHPTRFPNGLQELVAYIHSLGLKAGTYSDAGHNTCASYYGGDTDGIGTGLYEHDLEDARFMFNELGFDFIKVDFCGGDAPQNSERLDLDERQRYTEISEAIKSTGRTDVRYNVCRWAYPGTWVEDVATSWRMSQDIYDGWESVKDIIHQNLYLSAYASKGRFNDMDMLEVGRSMTEEEDKTHFGMWCMMSSPLLIGCDLRNINQHALNLLTNRELIALNQDPLALQAEVVKRVNGGYILVKDVEELHSAKRAVALYNPTDIPLEMKVTFNDIDLGGDVKLRDLFEGKDMGTYSGSYSVTVPAHGTRIYKAEAERRLERRVYEAETAKIAAYQELENNQVVKSGVYEEMDVCSGGAKAGWLGARADNTLSWQSVWCEEGGDYEMTIYYLTGADRNITVEVNGEVIKTLTVNSGGWGTVGSSTINIQLHKGDNVVTLSNSEDWMPDIDCMTLVRAGDLDLLSSRHKGALDEIESTNFASLPRVMAERYTQLIDKERNPENSREGYEQSIASIKLLKAEIEQALKDYEAYSKVYAMAQKTAATSESTSALTELESTLRGVNDRVEASVNPDEYIDWRKEIESAMRAYFNDAESTVKDGEYWDMTCLIENPDFDTNSVGWDEQPVWGSRVAEFWNRQFSTFQTVTGLREGKYVVSVQALYRLAGNDGGAAYKSGTEEIPANFVANEESRPILSLYVHPLSDTPELEAQLSGTHVLRGYVNSMYGAEQAFAKGLYVNELPVYVKDGALHIGVTSDTANGDCWCCFDNFGLRFYGTSNAAVEEIGTDAAKSYDVYNMMGICLGKGISADILDRLPAGIYIVNGKKMIINH